jgi:small-conductance mechanosensitive channel
MNLPIEISAWFAQITLQQLISYLLVPLLVFVVSLFIFQLVRAILYYRLIAFSERRIGAVLAERIKQVNIIAACVTAAYIAVQTIPNLSLTLLNLTYIGFLLIWIWQTVQFVIAIINYFTDKAIQRPSGAENEATYKLLSAIVKISVLMIAALLVLSNLGYDVTSLIAGLGIGGIAIALAVQSVLVDVITSFSIVADKTFKPGDFISFDNFSGRVIRIGIKSTRIRSAEGEELIVANSKLVSTVVRNYGSGQGRRSIQRLTVSKETEPKLLADIPVFISEILQTQEAIDKKDTTVALTKLEGGYVFEISFDIIKSSLQDFLTIQQEVLLSINEKLKSEGISFS